ncbi:hypothetical protein MINTM002_29040 [Mycobacterium intracellulare]|uniref:hypothetical protein n=1 Tax=Mycobacterium intracellulare TaxID=1767 RepID=UPI001927A9ED|nr:hypothetical protein [Mycobacterium intracellulare]BCO47230.1 hypothetical protein MINTM002_29040 [Mycobacterium intracellulare]
MSAIPFPYTASETTTDPAELLREAQIANRWLRGEVERLEAELATRQALVSQLLAEQVQNA